MICRYLFFVYIFFKQCEACYHFYRMGDELNLLNAITEWPIFEPRGFKQLEAMRRAGSWSEIIVRCGPKEAVKDEKRMKRGSLGLLPSRGRISYSPQKPYEGL